MRIVLICIRSASAAPAQARNVSSVNMKLAHTQHEAGSYGSAAPAQRILYQIGSRKGAMREPLRLTLRHRLDANRSQQPPDERSFRGLDSVLRLAYYVPMP